MHLNELKGGNNKKNRYFFFLILQRIRNILEIFEIIRRKTFRVVVQLSLHAIGPCDHHSVNKSDAFVLAS